MKLKKVYLVLLLLSILLLPSSTFAAGNGQWDYVGYSKFYKVSAVVYSTGGDFKACLISGPSGYYVLKEQDPYSSDDFSFPPQYYRVGGCVVYEGVDSAVDGPNNKAEFYLVKVLDTDTSRQSYVEFYD